MHLIKALTTPSGHELVNVPADMQTLLELGFDESQAQTLLQPLLTERPSCWQSDSIGTRWPKTIL